jgi:SEC-C motif-containing protein
MKCPCGSDVALEACCGPAISGERPAPTAEALMRSRYTAYTQKKGGYIVETHDPATRDEVDEKATQRWAEETEWLQLQVLSTEKGGEQDEDGKVEFVARFKDTRGREHSHHEHSTFKRVDGRWYYHDGEVQKQSPIKRAAPKVGRNDPCPCGSGKKYKKCCGGAAATA